MDQTKKPQVLRGAVLILAALAAVGFAGYNLIALLAFSAIPPVGPESMGFPTAIACIGMGLAWWSVLSLRGGPASAVQHRLGAVAPTVLCYSVATARGSSRTLGGHV